MKINSKFIDELNKCHIRQKCYDNIIFLILFLSILFAPLVQDIFQSSPISAQSFIGKDQLISMVNNFKYYVMKDKIFKGVISNQNGWLLYTGEISLDDFQNTDQFTSYELDQIKIRLDFLCSSLTQSGIKLILFFPPNKNTIYPEFMPSEIKKLNNESRLDQVLKIWRDTQNCKMIDVRSTLIEAKKNTQVYYSTDTHWNSYGAFLAYQELSKVLQGDFPTVKVRSLFDYQLKPSIYKGDLTTDSFGHFSLEEVTEDIVLDFEPGYIARSYKSADGYPIEGNFMTTYSKDTTLPSAIIYRDSFFTEIFPFIAENFSEALYFWSPNVDLSLINSKHPDYVICEYTERTLEGFLFSLPVPK